MSSQTITDEQDRTFLVLRALASRGPSVDAGEDVGWCAEVCDPASPLAGLYAFGDTPRTAGEALAIAAWAATNDGELIPFDIKPADLAGIRVDTTIPATYEAEWLTASLANHVA